MQLTSFHCILFFDLFFSSSSVFSNLILLIAYHIIQHFDSIIMAVVNPHTINFAVEVQLLCGPFPRIKLLKFEVQERQGEGIICLMGYFFSEILEVKLGLRRWDLDSLCFGGCLTFGDIIILGESWVVFVVNGFRLMPFWMRSFARWHLVKKYFINRCV